MANEAIEPDGTDRFSEIETGPRIPESMVWRGVIALLCLAWSAFQLYIADNPFDTWQARSIHLAFALLLAFLAFPAFREGRRLTFTDSWFPVPGGHALVFDLIYACLLLALAVWTLVDFATLRGDLDAMGYSHWLFVPVLVIVAGVVEGTRRLLAVVHARFGVIRHDRLRDIVCGYGLSRSVRHTIPLYDVLLGITAAAASLFIVLDYEGLITRQGLPLWFDVWVGVTCIVLLLEAARRALGPALALICLVFLVYLFVGPWMPDLLRHRGAAARLRGERPLPLDLGHLRGSARCLREHHLSLRPVRFAARTRRGRAVLHRCRVRRLRAFQGRARPRRRSSHRALRDSIRVPRSPTP